MRNDPQDSVLKPNILAAMTPYTVISLIPGVFAAFVVMVVLAPFVGLKGGIIAGVVGFVLTAGLILFFRYMNLRSIEYRFTPEQVEAYEGFLAVKQRNIAYDRITDVSLQKPIIQRIFGTGTIRINTAGSDINEIHLGYIDNPDEWYRKVKDIVSERGR